MVERAAMEATLTLNPVTETLAQIGEAAETLAQRASDRLDVVLETAGRWTRRLFSRKRRAARAPSRYNGELRQAFAHCMQLAEREDSKGCRIGGRSLVQSRMIAERIY